MRSCRARCAELEAGQAASHAHATSLAAELRSSTDHGDALRLQNEELAAELAAYRCAWGGAAPERVISFRSIVPAPRLPRSQLLAQVLSCCLQVVLAMKAPR
jgi:hypothetical protein